MTEKTIWVRVGASADVERAMKWVRRLAKAEGHSGDIPVMLLIGSFENHWAQVSFADEYNVSEAALGAIIDHFGDCNVQVQIETDGTGKQLERVAGSLEEITRYLKDLSNCVVEHQGRSILCVADAAGQ